MGTSQSLLTKSQSSASSRSGFQSWFCCLQCNQNNCLNHHKTKVTVPTQKGFLVDSFKELGTLYILIGFQCLGHWSILMMTVYSMMTVTNYMLAQNHFFFFHKELGKTSQPPLQYQNRLCWNLVNEMEALRLVSKMPPTSSQCSDCSVIHQNANSSRKHQATRWNK